MKSILFQKPLRDLTVAGKKTETRRTHGLTGFNTKPHIYEKLTGSSSKIAMKDSSSERQKQFLDGCYFFLRNTETDKISGVRSKYQPGEIVFIAEPVWVDDKGNCSFYEYFISDDTRSLIERSKRYHKRSPLFMKSEWALYHIKIKTVKLENLFDITEDGCRREGLQPYVKAGTDDTRYWIDESIPWDDKPKEIIQAFLGLFAAVAKDRDETFTSSNPFVFVYTYELWDYSK